MCSYEDRDGYIVRVNVSQPQRDSHFGVNLSSVLPWYKAFNLFAQLLHSQRFLAIYKLKPGDILTFDNLRICHGREAYGMSESSPKVIERHVKGAYMDWDEVSEDKSTLTLTWEDGHQSAFEADWLNERAFTPRARINRLSNYRGNRVLWDAKDFARISDNTNMSESSWSFPFDDILSKDSSLLAWLEYLENWGIAMIVGAEPCNGQLRKLAERVAFVRRTHYGELFSVRAKDEPSNVAYTSDKLQLHTDLPYYEYKPGVNMLQCIVQWAGPGGENHLVDSFAVAELMRQEHPKEYEILSKTIVDWVDIGKEPVGEDDGSVSAVKQERKAFHSIYRAPVIWYVVLFV
ncbi:hypothetical protein J437_LFUL007321 [Ladona fulva]|uniref:TauD/TfdA-like domain-containing protein n=1 Tax=Ladona fulva TaxID=123851 RepID=A0A8K0K7G1_LADFU|nr:hypothetical protein J437_LFUL007321 [Ladona fulva]